MRPAAFLAGVARGRNRNEVIAAPRDGWYPARVGYRLPLALAFALVLTSATVVPAADPPRPRKAVRPALDADETDALDNDDDQVEPSLPDDEDPGRDDELDERSGPRVGPRSSPSRPEDEEPPPADVEPAQLGPATPASPAEPLHPLGE